MAGRESGADSLAVTRHLETRRRGRRENLGDGEREENYSTSLTIQIFIVLLPADSAFTIVSSIGVIVINRRFRTAHFRVWAHSSSKGHKIPKITHVLNSTICQKKWADYTCTTGYILYRPNT